jgi:DNA-binding NarL/FixJ family response regulator
MRILIADDHSVVRKGLQKILAEAFGEVVFGEARDTVEALDLYTRESWDLVVLDLEMPGRNGLEFLKQIHPSHKPPVLVLSIHPESGYAVRALKSGAAGYLNKQSAPEELVRAVGKVLSGGKFVTPTMAEKLACDLDAGVARPPHEILSDREHEVLCLLASGKTLKKAADQLSLSPKTLSTYRARILEKMHLKTNVELTWYAIQNGLVGPEM